MNLTSLLRSAAHRYPALVLIAVCATVPLVVALTIGQVLDGFYQMPRYVGFISVVLLVIAGLVYLNRQTLLEELRAHWERGIKIHPNWILVLVAIGLRYGLLQLIPPGFASHEEKHQGIHAFKTVHYGLDLPFIELFSNLVATLGFAYLGYELEYLRWGFEVMGVITILLVAIGLRRLNIGWMATLMVVFILATTRWAVIAGSYAEDSFGGLVLVALLLVTIIFSDTSRRNQFFWAGCVGITSGLLLYEYIPFVMIAPLPVAYWFLRAVFSQRAGERYRTVKRGVWFIGAFVIITAPLLSHIVYDVIDDTTNSHVADIAMRNQTVERVVNEDRVDYFNQWRQDATDYLLTAFGLEMDRPSKLFRASTDSVVPLAVGAIFALSCLYALLRPTRIFPFFLALSVLVYAFLIGVPSGRFYTGRMTSMIPMLMILSGFMLDALLNFIERRNFLSASRVSILATVVTLAVIAVNFAGAVRMSSDEKTILEYVNNNYVLCKGISKQPYEFDKAIIVSEDHVHNCDFHDEAWLYPDRHFEPFNQAHLPDASEIAPGTLVLIGNTRGLSGEAATKFRELANATGNSGSIRETKTLFERTGTLSFCYQCGPRIEP